MYLWIICVDSCSTPVYLIAQQCLSRVRTINSEMNDTSQASDVATEAALSNLCQNMQKIDFQDQFDMPKITVEECSIENFYY